MKGMTRLGRLPSGLRNKLSGDREHGQQRLIECHFHPSPPIHVGWYELTNKFFKLVRRNKLNKPERKSKRKNTYAPSLVAIFEVSRLDLGVVTLE
jgi:hypothetical protein